MISHEMILTQMRALLAGHGCLDAAVEAINARWGGNLAKGTLSRRAHGEQPWPIHHVIALEDALGRYPVTRMMARRMVSGAPQDLVTSAKAVAKETGEAVSAMVGVALCSSSIDRANAVKEIDEAISALRMARAAICYCSSSDGGVASQPLRTDMNTGDGTLPAPSPHGTTQRRRSAAGLSAGHDSAPAMRRNGAAGPAESGGNSQGTINDDREARP